MAVVCTVVLVGFRCQLLPQALCGVRHAPGWGASAQSRLFSFCLFLKTYGPARSPVAWRLPCLTPSLTQWALLAVAEVEGLEGGPVGWFSGWHLRQTLWGIFRSPCADWEVLTPAAGPGLPASCARACQDRGGRLPPPLATEVEGWRAIEPAMGHCLLSLSFPFCDLKGKGR